MHITDKTNTRKYKRDNILSHLLVSGTATGAKHSAVRYGRTVTTDYFSTD